LLEWIELQNKLAAIKAVDNESAPQPYWVACELRPHQRSAVQYLDNFSHCANFDPPGAMKTRVAVAFAMKDRLPALIICPAQVKYHWRNEIRQCDPAANPVVVEGNPKAFQGSDLTGITGADWVIVNFDLLKVWLPIFPPRFKTIICDESQTVINSKSQRGNAMLRACEQVANVHYMTGSPALKRPADLESMLIALGYLSPRERFSWRVRFTDGHRVCINENGVKYQHREPQYRWSFSGASNIDLLARELDMFSVRRPASAIKTSMPSVPVHTLLEVDLPDMREHNTLWKQMKSMLKSGDPHIKGQALSIFGKLLRWCAVQKHQVMMDLITERLDAGESPVVFADFYEPLDMLRGELNGRSMSFDGRLSHTVRERVKEQFVKSPSPLALLTCRPGAGTGLDGLQHRAHSVIFQTLPVIPEHFKQAYCRVAREGQTQSVEVITTLARGTIEEAVLRIVYERAKVTDVLCSNPSLSDEQKAAWARALSLIGV
jgi:SNF2 family DNA or RNA helicase